jgi:tetratricopeptide (TPR) repeat protein
MISIRSVALALIAALAFVSCSRDPNVAKKRYLDSGNKYFDKGRLKEASIQYRNAIKIDPRYGLAHYKLALVALKSNPQDWGGAVRELRRAMELIPASQQEHWDAEVKLTEIYLLPIVKHDDSLMAEVEGFCNDLLKRDPNSFDGHRLVGDLNYTKAVAALEVKQNDVARQDLDKALAEYHKADAIQPGNQGVEMQLARVLWRSLDFPAAEQGFRAVIAKDKTNLEAYRELYTLLWAQNKRPDAEAVLKSGYQNNPKQFLFLISLAEQYLRENRRDDMLGVLQQIKSKAGEFPMAYFEVGDFYLRVGDGDSAIREYKEGIGKDGKNKAVYQKRIIEVLMKQGKRTDAAGYVEQILKDNPKDPDARGVEATLALERGDIAKALPELQQVATASPNNPVAHFNLARGYFAHGEAEQARQQFARAIELRPDYISARLGMALLQVARQEYDAALRSTQDILKYDPNNASAKLLASAAMVGQQRWGDSRQVLDQILKVNPSSAEATYQMGVVDLGEKKYKDAEAAFRRSYELNPANTRGLMGVKETYMAQGMTDKAVQFLQAEIAKAPARMEFHLELGNVGVRAGRFDMAIAEFQQVLAGTPKGTTAQGLIYLEMGDTYQRKGDFASAINALQEARKTLPNDERVLTDLAITLGSADRWPEARQVYEATMKIDPNNGIVLNNLAFGLAEHNGDLDQALTMAQQAKRLLPTMAEVSDTLAWIYLKKNLPDQALPILHDIVTKNPGRPTFHYHLGMAMAQKLEKAQAREEANKALALNPATDEKKQIQDFLSRL